MGSNKDPAQPKINKYFRKPKIYSKSMSTSQSITEVGRFYIPLVFVFVFFYPFINMLDFLGHSGISVVFLCLYQSE